MDVEIHRNILQKSNFNCSFDHAASTNPRQEYVNLPIQTDISCIYFNGKKNGFFNAQKH